MNKILKWKISQEIRLSFFLKEKLKKDYNALDISQMIRNQRCLVNKKIERFESTTLLPDDEVLVFPKKFSRIKFDSNRILLDSPYYLIYNKPAYISSEQLAKTLQLQIIHRLDRDTTGCIIFSKSKKNNLKLINLFKKKIISKQYLAYVSKTPNQKQGIIKSFLYVKKRREGALVMASSPFPDKGKLAITQWKLLKKTKFGAIILCSPITGRTHQIRLHLYDNGFPIIGDLEYQNFNNSKYFAFRYLLHAFSLSFTCPFTNKKIKVSNDIMPEPIYYFSSTQDIKFLNY